MQEEKPWYKHRLVWMLILFPALAVLGGINMIYLAYTNHDGLVSDNYYKDGQEINQRLALDQQASAKGITAQVLIGEDQQNVRVILNQAVEGTLTLKIVHPTKSGVDQTITLAAQGPMLFSGKLAQPLAAERWQIEVGDQKNTWRLSKEWQVLPDEPLLLSPNK
jgi:hypothetical protein